MAGASWVHDHILGDHPSADIRVYSVWMPMLAGDSRSHWDEGVLADKRVVEFWDEELVAGTWLGQHLDDFGAGEQTGGVFWDAFLVFDKSARWDAVPSSVVDAGSTVLRQSEQLQEALGPLL